MITANFAVDGTLTLTLLALGSLAPTEMAFGDSVRQGWELVSREDNLAIYIKAGEGADTVSIRGETIIAADPQDVLDALDAQNEIQWTPYLSETKTLEDRGELGRIEYSRMHFPPPVSDRYFIMLRKRNALPDGGWKIVSRSIDDPKPQWLDRDNVMGYVYGNEITVRPTAGGKKTSFAIEACSDPKGMIPKWIINRGQRSFPREYFNHLTDYLSQRHLLHPDATP